MSTFNQSATPPSCYLNIGDEHQKDEFLKAMLPGFLQVVDPWNSGLLDHMIAEGLISDWDQESLAASNVRTSRDLRRKLWFLLTRMTVADLRTKVFPKLLQDFPHILPTKFVATGTECLVNIDDENISCLRHKMKIKLRPDCVIDKMYQYDCFDLTQYTAYSMGGCSADQLWTMLFSMCSSQHPRLQNMVQELLENERIPTPPDLGSLVSRGIPCTCQQRGDELPTTPLSHVRSLKVASWVRESPFGNSARSSLGAGSTLSTNISSSLGSQEQEECAANSGQSKLHHASAPATLPPPDAACFGRSASFTMGRGGGGQVNMGCDVGSDWPSVSVAVSGPNTIPANAVVPFPVPDPSQGTGGGRSGFTGQLTSVVRDIRKFVERHCLIIVAFLAIFVLFDTAMNGFHIFRLNHIECEPSEPFMSAMRVLLNEHLNDTGGGHNASSASTPALNP